MREFLLYFVATAGMYFFGVFMGAWGVLNLEGKPEYPRLRQLFKRLHLMLPRKDGDHES